MDENKKELCWAIGVLSDPLEEQAKRQGYKLQKAEMWQRLLDGLVLAWVQNIITESMYNKALERFTKKIGGSLKKVNEDGHKD